MTMTLISTSTAATAQANFTFSSIVGTFTDLQLVVNGRSSLNDGSVSIESVLTFNSNTSGYTAKQLYGDGSSAASNSPTSRTGGLIPANWSSATANVFSNNAIYIPNYSGSTNKSYSVDSVTENNNTLTYMSIIAGLWSNTAAITSIVIAPSSGNWMAGSTASLYGILKGSGGATVS